MSKKFVILTRVLIGVVAVVAVFLIVVATRPNDYRIERSTTIAAPASSVYGRVSDFRKWKDWSPWEELDPAMKKSIEGVPGGVGSFYAWDGNDKAGAGRMTLVESRPNELVGIKLEFFRPMEDSCSTNFSFKPEGEKVHVDWVMEGKHTFMSKAICLFMDMDKMVGGDFEKGLARLKALAETSPPPGGSSPAESGNNS